jgi:phosphate transport system substrate-binding protein
VKSPSWIRGRSGARAAISLWLSLCILALAGLAGCTTAERREDVLVVTGSTTVLPIAEIAREDFEKLHPETRVEVSGVGSSAGIEAVAAGTAQIGTSSRDLKDEEKTLGLVDTPIAYDGIAVIVHPDNPVKNLTTEQLQGIFSGKITNWADVGGDDRPVNLVNRDEASGTREAFKKLVMGDVPFDPAAAVLPGTGQVRDVVSRSEGAVGYISLGFVSPKFAARGVKAVWVDGVEPTPKTIASGKYPIGRTLHFFTKGQPQGLAKEFTDFVLSPAIQKSVVVDAGFLPITAKSGAGQ